MEPLIPLLAAAAKPLLMLFFSLTALVGLLALISPRSFALVVEKANCWIDTSKFFSFLEKRIDLDHYAVRHSRVTGILVLVGTAILGWVYLRS